MSGYSRIARQKRRIERQIRDHFYKMMSHYYEKKYRKSLFTQEDIKDIVRKNRQTLSSINNWLEDDVYENSVFYYGLPRHIKHLLDKPINDEITYSDAMCYLQSKIKGPINYLELGVSVGKNFFQFASYLENVTLTGFDLEEINPTLEKQFSEKEIKEKWETPLSSKKKEMSSLTYYKFNNNQIKYLSGDIFDENSWARLKGEKFNLIFSDAYHTPEAIKFEYNMLKKYDLIDYTNFMILWDDLGGRMTRSFIDIYNDLRLQYDLEPQNVALNRYWGWLGQGEHKHLIGVLYKI
jgi:hypothetical protein